MKNSNPLEKQFADYQKLLITGITEEQLLKKFGLKTKPPLGLENYNYLNSIWEQEKVKEKNSQISADVISYL